MAEPSARVELIRSWPTLLGAFLGVAAGVTALPYYTQGVFVPPLTQEFSWTREQMSIITLAGGIVLAGLSPFVGLLIDRVGVRLPLAASLAAMVVGYVGLSLSDADFRRFLLLQVLVFAVGAVTGPVAFTRVVNQRFVAMRGVALGVTLAGAGAMAVVAPPLVAQVIESVGWRAAYRTMALVMFAVGAVALILLWPAAGPRELRTNQPPAGLIQGHDSRLNRLLFMQLLVTFALLALGIGGFVIHMIPLLTDAGMTLTRAAEVQSLIGVSVLIGRLGTGFLVDRYFAPRVSAFIMTLAALGVIGLASFGPAAAPACALLIGFAIGTEGDVIGYLTARYFGLTRYGRLYGVLYGVFALGLGLSPLLVARMHQTSGAYDLPLWTSAALLFLGAVSLLTLPKFHIGR